MFLSGFLLGFVLLIFLFLCVVFCILYLFGLVVCDLLLVFVLCLVWPCCQCMWTVYSWLPLWFSLTFIYTLLFDGFFFGGVRNAHIFSLLFFVLLFFFLSSCVLCAQCCQCLWTVHSRLHLRFSLTFILLTNMPVVNIGKPQSIL